MSYSTSSFTASDSKEVFYHKWEPKNKEFDKVLLLIHGSVEHGKRYDEFARLLNENGYLVVAPDHRGHGLTAQHHGVFSHFEDGYERVIQDIIDLNSLVDKKYEGSKKYIFGHSLGSFLTRKFISLKGGEFEKAIISGSSWGNDIEAKGGMFFSKLLGLILGLNKPNKFYNDFFWGVLNSKIKNRKTTVDFISRDEKVVEDYLNDDLCGRVMTIGFGIEMTRILLDIRKTSVFENTPNKLKILLASGTEDPLSNKGKDIEKIAQMYRKNGLEDVKVKLYQGARHEILNEINKEEVQNDLINFLNK
jgi:alpha-beta hydrolase superfamily lysophospholipase